MKSMTSKMKSYVFVTASDESILFITDLIGGDISRNTQRNHVLLSLQQVFIALRF